MRYHCLHIQTDFGQEWQKDIFDQTLCELGVDTIDGETYYLPSDIWAEKADEIEGFCRSTEGAKLLEVKECPDENWNATWEAEHPMQELPLGVRIIPHCAFGAGHHETTSMMIEALQSSDLQGKRVLDHGTGTGVLAIFAKRLGAQEVVAVDIDEKSVVNAQENALLNGVTIDVQLGSTVPEGRYDLILANIHRNILLDNMARYAACLAPKGQLWLSGFYETDCPTLQRSAEAQGLRLIASHAKGEWRMLQLELGA